MDKYDEKAEEVWNACAVIDGHLSQIEVVTDFGRECAARAYEDAADIDEKDGYWGSKSRVQVLRAKAAALRAKP